MSIKLRIVFLFGIVAAVIALLGTAVYRSMIAEAEHVALHEATSVAQTVILLVEEYAKLDGRRSAEKNAELQEHIMRMKELGNRDIVIMDRNKRIIADAVPAEIGTVFGHDGGNEVAMTLLDGIPRTFTEKSEAYPQGIMQVVVPFGSGLRGIKGAVVLEYTPLYRDILLGVQQKARMFLWSFLGALALLLGMALVASRSFSRPLSRLQDAARAVAEGDLQVRVEHRSQDELGALAGSFNKMVEALRDSRREQAAAEEKFRALFENATDGIFIVDLTGKFIDVNRTAYERLGYTKEEMLAMRISDLNAPEFNAVLPERLARIREQGSAIFESAHRRKDGTVMPVEVNARMLEFDGRPAMLSSIRDITQRKQADEEMRAMNQRLQTLVQAIPDMVLFKDRAGRHLLVNRAAESILGRPAAEILGATDRDLLPPETAAACRRSDEEVFRTLRPVYSEEQVRQVDGGMRFIDLVKAPLVDDRGEAYGLVAIGRDVTERKRSEEILRESEEQYRELVENVNSIVLRWTGDGRIAYLNRFGLHFFGFRKDELIGRHVIGTIVPANDQAGEDLTAMIENIAREPDRYRNNLNENICKDGRRVRVSWTNRLVMTPGGQVKEILSIGNDVTERLQAEDAYREVLEQIVRDRTAELLAANDSLRREMEARERMEAELVKAQKLESLGILAGGIAHDFNNLLTTILGRISLAVLDLNEQHPAYREIMRAERASLRAQDLAQQLLTFSKGGSPVKRTTSIGDLIRESAEFALRGSKVRCELAIAGDLRPVDVDEGQISQVLNNLIINADHAMPDGGTITIRCENTDLPAPDGPLLPAGRYVRITFTDQGVGISPEHLSKVFDPYFTTKSRGSGLGLATSHSIIKKHGGSIAVRSEPGAGATFIIHLPASTGVLTPGTAKGVRPLKSAGRVLIMDDEEDIRELAESSLRRLGYDVESAVDGAVAIDRYARAQRAGTPFDVVIMDLTVPGGMGGQEAVRLLHEIDPAATVLVSSGYSNDPVMANFREHGFSGVVTKPYRVQQLAEAVQKAMAAGGGQS